MCHAAENPCNSSGYRRMADSLSACAKMAESEGHLACTVMVLFLRLWVWGQVLMWCRCVPADEDWLVQDDAGHAPDSRVAYPCSRTRRPHVQGCHHFLTGSPHDAAAGPQRLRCSMFKNDVIVGFLNRQTPTSKMINCHHLATIVPPTPTWLTSALT